MPGPVPGEQKASEGCVGISNDAEKAFDKIQRPLMIILLSEKLEVFPSKSGRRQRRPLSPRLLSPRQSSQARKINERPRIRKEVKILLSADDRLAYVADTTDSTQLLELLTECRNVVGHKIGTQKSVVFRLLATNHLEKK